MLHLYAVDHALGSLELPLSKKEAEDKEKKTLTQWLDKCRVSQNAINSILSLPSQSQLAKGARCVCVVYVRVCVCVVFITHCVWCYPQLITISCSNLQRSLDSATVAVRGGIG